MRSNLDFFFLVQFCFNVKTQCYYSPWAIFDSPPRLLSGCMLFRLFDTSLDIRHGGGSCMLFWLSHYLKIQKKTDASLAKINIALKKIFIRMFKIEIFVRISAQNESSGSSSFSESVQRILNALCRCKYEL